MEDLTIINDFSNTNSEDVFWYELLFRGVSPGAYPKGAFTSEHSHINSKGKLYGAVAYTEPLTSSQVSDYELKGIQPPRPLYDYEKELIKNKFR